MIFEGTRGTSLYGDIGLDDIKLLPSTQGKCPKSTDCTFEYGMCAWSNTLIGDIFDWSMRKGNTPSTGTGPSADHTLNSASGNAIPEKNYHANMGAQLSFSTRLQIFSFETMLILVCRCLCDPSKEQFLHFHCCQHSSYEIRT